MLWGLTRRVVTLFILQVFLPVTTNNILFQELCRGNLIGCPLPSIQWVVNIVNITASNCLHIIFWRTYRTKSVMSLTNSKIMQGLFFCSVSREQKCQLVFYKQFIRLGLSSPRAKRAGPKGLRAESARAVTGRRNSYSGISFLFLQ